jgi:hypothetical protein
VDLNRNYAERWGGPGSTDEVGQGGYHGPKPFSEPETQNIRELVLSHQVVTLISNHTYRREILRQPGLQADPLTPDEPVYASLGADMAGATGYQNLLAWQLYDHVGTTDGWAYYGTGALSYVFESQTAYHPPYQQVADEDAGVMKAYFMAAKSTMEPMRHAVIAGEQRPGTVLRLTKTFIDERWNKTSPTTFERVDTTMEVPSSGRYEWHVNPSGLPRNPGVKWTLSCEQNGQVLAQRSISIERGGWQELGVEACAAA